MIDLVEVRVLGPFRVRTDDGDLVDPRAWRTAKTRDLVRLLAIAGGEPVSTESLVDALWPTPDPARGRASLRTAASHVRHVLGEEHLVRTSAGLALVGAWVDATTFAGLARTAEHLLASGDEAAGVTTAWEAVNLYGGDLCEDEPYAEWVTVERERYRGILRALLLGSAEAAADLSWLRDAYELASRALLLDPGAERAYRCLMRTHARLGETERAVAMFERCRRYLADELGVDPAPETQALHLTLLRAPQVEVPAPPFVGHDAALAQVAAQLGDAVAERQPVALLVTGPAGSGRSRFVEEVLEDWPHRSQVVRLAPGGPRSCATTGLDDLLHALNVVPMQVPRGGEPGAPAGPLPLMVVLEDLHRAAADDLDVLDHALAGASVPLAVLATADVAQAVVPLSSAGLRWQEVALPPLPRELVDRLLESMLGGTPSTALATDVLDLTGGWPGAVVDAASRLLRSGDLLTTSDGLASAPAAPDRPAGREDARLARTRAQAGPVGAQVLDVLAVLNRPTSLGALVRLTEADVSELVHVLGQLVDCSVLVRREGLYGFADPVAREAAYRWLRPSARDGLHRLVAETADLPAALRVEHWVRCGEAGLACAAAMEAADAALARGDDGAARSHLMRVRAFATENAVHAADRVELDERLAEVAERLGFGDEARALVEDAIVLARLEAPELLARLYRRLGRLARTSAEALVAYDEVRRSPALDAHEQIFGILSVAAVSVGSRPDEALLLLERAVEDADAGTDVAAQVEARVLLARAAGLTRRLVDAERVATEALWLAEAEGSHVLFARAAHARVQTQAFLGGGLAVLGLTRRAWEHSLLSEDPAAIGDVGLTYCLVLHELGSPDFDAAWRIVRGVVDRTGHRRLFCLLDAMFSMERGHLAQAERLLEAVPAGLDNVVAGHAEQLALARVAEARGDVRGAVSALTGVVEDTRARTVALLVPEAAARLALLLAPIDPGAAEEYLTRGLVVGGPHLHPREHVCVLMATAAVLAAQGRAEEGATVALAAATTARRAGLVHLEAESTRLRARLHATVVRIPAQSGSETNLRALGRPGRAAEPTEAGA